ncbi:MAG: hypothetical protein OHK93_006548 [Ramalina farinacea]|uniref:Uncharacterized protein n=1 Tax=Ramalina farinacea TaxID=258253 RepID=A0AA43QL25_9LECA|nr:hypothetical protein [Ramalina farinacea]
MSTLRECLPSSSSTTAIIIPGKPSSQTISYAQLFTHVSQLQGEFARLGITPQAAVSIALPNSYEFVVAFLAATWQRAVAAPLNPAYRQEEFEFYLNDLKSIILLLPKGAFEKKGPALHTSGTTGRPKAVRVISATDTWTQADIFTPGRAPVIEAYAMTEAAHQMTSNPLPPAKRLPGSVGIGQGVEVLILDLNGSEVPRGSEGEICIKGQNVTDGYLDNPEANAAAFTNTGYFRTGDQGRQDDKGYIFITGRIKELINKAGEKISPVELDNVISQNAAVEEAVSFAIPDDLKGQDIGVAIVPAKGLRPNAQDLRDWISQRVASFKTPKEIFFTDQMPKTATGKVQRKMVAEAMLKQKQLRSKL